VADIMRMDDTYKIKIDQFEGPFDLLMFFIQRDELDIYDIPIAKITEDFQSYIVSLEQMNINVASEFILMAATLLHIKAKMLLPRQEKDALGNEIDPRTDLINQLIEYKKIKEVIVELEKLEEERSKMHLRAFRETEAMLMVQELSKDAELEPIPVYKLFIVFKKLLERYEDNGKRVQTVVKIKYNINQEKNILLRKISTSTKSAFENIFDTVENRLHAVVVFLALLELLTAGEVKILLGIGKNNFWIEKNEAN
jgi:segregation and condensation protein A